MFRTLKYILIYLIFIISAFGEKALIASFNTLHLGWKSSNYYRKAEVIAPFDFVVLQEVMKKDGLKHLDKELERITGEEWEWHVSRQGLGRGEKYKEHYAFIYRKDKVRFVKSLGTYEEENDEFIREPYGAQFAMGDFDFVVVNCHLVFGKSKKDRQLEAMELSKVYDYFKNKSGDDDVLIAGDFNLPAYDDAFSSLFSHPDLIFYAIDPGVNKTTIGTKALANSYDNIFYSFVNTKEYTGQSGVYDYVDSKEFVEKYGEERYKEARKEISDHLPIYIEVEY